MRTFILLTFIISVVSISNAQVGINTETPMATLQVSTTAANDNTIAEGIDAPILTRSNLIAKDALYGTDQIGAIVYVSNLSGTPTAKTILIDLPGYYYFDGSLWQPLIPEPWYKIGGGQSMLNTDSIYHIGKVVINGNLIAKVYGEDAALSVYSSDALINGITVGRGKGNRVGNVAIGENALSSITTGTNNIAIGYNTLPINTTGSNNISLGSSTTQFLTSGDNNISIGYLVNNKFTTGSSNISIGSQSGFPIGTSNIAIGYKAGNDSIGDVNTGINNITIGALSRVVYGSNCTAIGNSARINGIAMNHSIAIGDSASVQGNYSVAIGKLAKVVGQNSMALGYGATNNADNTIVLGTAQVTSIRAAVTSITALSDRRVKKDIQDNVPGLAFINKLNPVTYNLNLSAMAAIEQTPDTINPQRKNEIEKITHTGFIAQEVEKAAQEINYDFDGVSEPQNKNEIYGVNYTSFIPSLIKALQEQKKQIDEQDQFIEEQRVGIAKQDSLVLALRKRLETLESKTK